MSDMHRHCDADLARLGNEARLHVNTVTKACGYWYACGYNDHRQPETGRVQPYVDASAFAEHWLTLNQEAGNYLPSLQDAFRAWMRLQS